MATSSKTISSRPVLPVTNEFQRSISPYANFCSSAFASSSSSCSNRRTDFFPRSASSPSVHFPIDLSTSQNKSIYVSPRNQVLTKQNNKLLSGSSRKKTCLCSPTTHPGSFRCHLHKNINSHVGSYPSNRLNARRSAMTNSLVRIGTVEGDLVGRALAALIRPSSHQQKRREEFQRRPSRLSIMSKAENLNL